jgi:adenylylsulfate kinase
MGLPGSGKTTIAAKIASILLTKAVWVNADRVRQQYNDWDFSPEGRLRQANRMRTIADHHTELGRIALCDFVAPTDEIRSIFDADVTIWMDTITEGRFEDTNKVFEAPKKYDFRITEQDADKWAPHIANELVNNGLI